MGLMKTIYSKEIEGKHVKNIRGDREQIYFNRLYKMENSAYYFYYNSRGYYHIMIPRTYKTSNKIFSHDIEDYILTKDGNLRYTKTYGTYRTRDDLYNAYKDMVIKSGGEFID